MFSDVFRRYRKIWFNTQFFKQIDGCQMGGPLLVSFSDIHMTGTESNVAKPVVLLFYRRFVDDIINRRKKKSGPILFLRI